MYDDNGSISFDINLITLDKHFCLIFENLSCLVAKLTNKANTKHELAVLLFGCRDYIDVCWYTRNKQEMLNSEILQYITISHLFLIQDLSFLTD